MKKALRNNSKGFFHKGNLYENNYLINVKPKFCC